MISQTQTVTQTYNGVDGPLVHPSLHNQDVYLLHANRRWLQMSYLLPPMLPCGQPFMSGEPWKAAFPWPCCIIGDWVWAMRGESRGLCGVPGPPKPPSACWLIPAVDGSERVNQSRPAGTQLHAKLQYCTVAIPRKLTQTCQKKERQRLSNSASEITSVMH